MDLYTKEEKQAQTKSIPLKTEVHVQQKMPVYNNMRKPQAQWIKEIDNSYNRFVPLIKEKYYEVSPIPEDITKIQQEKEGDPMKYKVFEMKDWRI